MTERRVPLVGASWTDQQIAAWEEWTKRDQLLKRWSFVWATRTVEVSGEDALIGAVRVGQGLVIAGIESGKAKTSTSREYANACREVGAVVALAT